MERFFDVSYGESEFNYTIKQEEINRA